ncbi:RAMP superfamily CRISPR-associated protein [Paraliomyxa miuraensis]|uniref:RAMP superfamily CRISPR-associated protein n=1 Tax=Paraliomyxa miuraensis TaxID=376150 RepID=UPI00224E08D0|nr:RAMP superfamily CRISPR-associated protein [Paraliomyxa miuraensis]MCX4242505.1 RAMP superfamily CRISPR-associated protein [Paraliomyxa miuraensis]
MARVELELEWLDDVESPSVEPVPKAQRTFGVRVRLESPTALGTPQASDNFRNARGEIPGSVLRGAIGFAIARALPKEPSDEENERFQALVDEHEGAHFGFLYPVDTPTRATDQALPAPWPVTARACKVEPRTHGVVDTLLDRIAAAAVRTPTQAARVHAGALRECLAKPPSDRARVAHGRCDAPLRGASGTRRSDGDLPKRVITRVSIERRSSSARDGALYSYELLEPGTVFEGTIRSVPEGSQGLLASALRLPVHVGRGASAGWGRVSVEVFEPPTPPPLAARGASFEAAVREHLRTAGLPTDGLDRLLPVTFLSPYLPDQGADDDGRTLERAIGRVEDWVIVARRFEREGGWDQRTGQPFAELAISAGAVYVARLATPWCEALAALEALEQRGAGRRRHQGYGHLVLFDPFILNRGNTP